MKEGWLCPRCGRVNNPLLIHCDCLSNLDSNIDIPENKENKVEEKGNAKDGRQN